jgi:hypothetical protein
MNQFVDFGICGDHAVNRVASMTDLSEVYYGTRF